MRKCATKNSEKPVYHWIMSKFDLVRQIPLTLMFQNKQQMCEELSNTIFGVVGRGNRAVVRRDEEFNTIVEEYEGVSSTVYPPGSGQTFSSDTLLAVYQFSSIKCNAQTEDS